MRNILAKAGLAALIALGAVSATAGSAAAGSDFGVGIYIGEPGYYPGERRGWEDPYGRYERHDRYEHHDRYERRQYRPCNPGRAVEKARWNGLRHARVQRVTPRKVVVAGYRHGDYDRMVFANVRGCPIIGY
ncbi:hypothetical protein DFR48_101304 [Ciceribacter lividus]|uniref:Antifreeze protein n=1 Tax=Ciceribacter lividus TaxID=1197950 RepID=A0A6I7HRC1_9HYPH|nr:hypothetical protein [Ciceribacter lividus]RCW28294.1 hypothetical protein DFR48_101304 [Ciceribacter lividus]